jgi:hypothetical protein
LLHGSIEISFLVQEISVFAEYDIFLEEFHASFIRQIYGKNIEVPLI